MISADASQAEAELAELQTAWRGALTSITTGITDVAKRVAMAGGIAFAGQAAVLALAYSAVAKYDLSLRQTMVIGNLTEQEMWSLNTAINESAARWGVAADEIAAGTLMLAKAGLRGSEISSVMDVLTQAVVANGVSWEVAARAYVVAISTFRNEGLSAVQIFDEFQAAANLSVVNLEDFAGAFGYAASMVRVTGGSMEELLATMALLTNAGQQAGIASRGFNQLLTTWVASAPAIQAWADSLGLGVQVMKDGRVNLEELLAAFAASGKAATYTADDFSVLFQTMDRNAARAFGFLLLNAGQYDAVLRQITNSSGALGTVAAATAQSLQSEWAQVVQTLMAVLRNKDVIDGISAAFTVLKDVLQANAGAFRDIIVTVIRDFAGNLPQLLALLKDLLQLGSAMLPVWNAFAQTFVLLAQGFMAIPEPLRTTILLAALLGKILPVQTLVATGKAVYALYEQFDLLRIGMSLDPLGAMVTKATLLKGALIGVGLAAGGVVTAMMAMGADSREMAAVYSTLTGITWGLAAAQFALMAANMGVATFGIGTAAAIGLTAGALAAIGTYVAATAGKSYQTGTSYVPETGPYVLHRGERVLTAEENRLFMSALGGGWGGGGARRGAAGGSTTTYSGGVHGGSQTFNLYQVSQGDIRYLLARFGL